MFYEIPEISIHAPAKGATGVSPSHSRYMLISIHAPAKGATVTADKSDRREQNFNPRSREGSDPLWVLRQTVQVSFQSTLPRRERRDGSSRLPDDRYFNPRSREGSDLYFLLYSTQPCGFQSTLPRRERPRLLTISQTRKQFQSTLPRRERRRLKFARCVCEYFNPRSREGSDC